MPDGQGSPGTRSAGSTIQRVASPSVDVSWVAKTVSGLKTCRQISMIAPLGTLCGEFNQSYAVKQLVRVQHLCNAAH